MSIFLIQLEFSWSCVLLPYKNKNLIWNSRFVKWENSISTKWPVVKTNCLVHMIPLKLYLWSHQNPALYWLLQLKQKPIIRQRLLLLWSAHVSLLKTIKIFWINNVPKTIISGQSYVSKNQYQLVKRNIIVYYRNIKWIPRRDHGKINVLFKGIMNNKT